MDNDPKLHFNLLDLPTEIRIMIYKSHLASLNWDEPMQLIKETKRILGSSRLLLKEYHNIMAIEICKREQELVDEIGQIKIPIDALTPSMRIERRKLFMQFLHLRKE